MYTQAMDTAPKEERKAVRSLEEAELERRFAWLDHPPRQVTGPRGRAYQQAAVGNGAANVRVNLRLLQHVVGSRGHDCGLGRREALRGNQAQAIEPHGLHRPGRRADVARVRDADEDDADRHALLF